MNWHKGALFSLCAIHSTTHCGITITLPGKN